MRSSGFRMRGILARKEVCKHLWRIVAMTICSVGGLIYSLMAGDKFPFAAMLCLALLIWDAIGIVCCLFLPEMLFGMVASKKEYSRIWSPHISFVH
jgi:hypothetical protein